MGAAEKVFHYLDRKPDLPPPGTLAPSTLQGLVNFQNVSFVYPSRPDQPTLQVPDGGRLGPLLPARLEERGGQEKGQASDSSPAVLGSDVHPESWADDGAGGAQRVWEEHGGRAAAESVPAHRGPGAAGRGAGLRV